MKKRKVSGNAGEKQAALSCSKQAALSCSNFMQCEVASQKPEGPSRCVPSKENKPDRERGRSRLAGPEQVS